MDSAKEVLGEEGWDVQHVDELRLLDQSVAEVYAGRVTFPAIRELAMYSLSQPVVDITVSGNGKEFLGAIVLNHDRLKEVTREGCGGTCTVMSYILCSR